MKPSHLLVIGAVVAVCGAALVLFTDIEVSVVRWASCGPFATQQEDRSELCR
ncbi:hypothetical protein KBY76_06005 [Synechococcus sp. GreenBA-s]|nr:hypothetical protein [Synechococcus sp. GreenBA-s]